MPSRAQRGRVAALLGAAALLLSVACAPSAVAAPPPNDNYLASTIMRTSDGAFPRTWSRSVDTTEATVQGDLFQPNRDGQPLGGAPAEPTSCDGQAFGRTVWFDLAPPIDGGVELTADGYDTTVAVYEFDPGTSLPTRLVACAATPGAGERLVLPETVKGGKSYTVQVGGAGGAGGALAFGFEFFGDRDGDGILDTLPDACPDLPGISSAGGCPPRMRPTVTFRYSASGGAVRLARVLVGKVPKGARVVARAGGRRQSVTARSATVRLSNLVGAAVRRGGRLTVQVTMPRRATSGKYRHGAIGAYYRYTSTGRGLGTRVERCLLPGETRLRKRCTGDA